MTTNNKSDIDSLTIKRDALLDKKRIVDNVDKLVQRNPTDTPIIKTTLGTLVENIPNIDWDSLNGILNILESEKIIIVTINKDASSWGEYDADLFIGKEFARQVTEIRNDYHKINEDIDKIQNVKTSNSSNSQKSKSKKVFIVHGSDNELKEATARLIEKLSLEPIILHEQPNKGNTLIEKLESNSSDVKFAIILLTPDDKIKQTSKKNGNGVFHARQNVILELGYFFGKLGRPNVCAIYKETVQLPSDFKGIVYIPFDNKGAWQYQLAKELKAAGLDADMNKLA